MVQFSHQEQMNEANAQDEGRVDFSTPMPPGDYIARIIESDWVETKDGGHYYKLVFEIMTGEHAGRFIWHNLNSDPAPKHSADTAAKMQRIAGGQMQKMCAAVRLEGALVDTDQLHDIPMSITVAIKEETTKNGQTYKASNKITNWKGAKSESAAKGGKATGNQDAIVPDKPAAAENGPTGAAGGGSKKPWE